MDAFLECNVIKKKNTCKSIILANEQQDIIQVYIFNFHDVVIKYLLHP